VTAAYGSFESPLLSPLEDCPSCAAGELYGNSYEDMLARLASIDASLEVREDVRKRQALRCAGCGWQGSAWREEFAPA